MGLNLGNNTAKSSGGLGGGGIDTSKGGQSSGGGINLSKGSKISLAKESPGLKKVLVGLGWDTQAFEGQEFDLDAQAFLTDASKKVTKSENFIFYNNTTSPCGGVTHNGDNRTGAGEGDDETLSITLSQVAPDVEKIVFTVTIHDATTRQQNFGQVENAFIRLVNEETGQEIARYDLTEDYSTSMSLVVGELYRHNDDWKFSASGNGLAKELGGLLADFGL